MSEVRTSPKKARRPQARSLPLRAAIHTVAAEYDRMSVRQLFYQLVSRRAIEKTEQAYKRVCDVSAQMRLDGSLDYRKIVDGHRTRRSAWSFGGLSEALELAAEMYRRNYWINQPINVEVWCEKDALSGVIHPVCDEYGVTYVATRGFPSITLIYETAVELAQLHKPTHIYYFGDHDPSGRAISKNLEPDLRAHGAEVRVIRMGLEPPQIARYQLPTRPSKKTDSRYSGFVEEYGNASVELDALPPNVLTALVRHSIRAVIDWQAWERAQQAEALERQTLASVAQLPLLPGQTYKMHDDN